MHLLNNTHLIVEVHIITRVYGSTIFLRSFPDTTPTGETVRHWQPIYLSLYTIYNVTACKTYRSNIQWTPLGRWSHFRSVCIAGFILYSLYRARPSSFLVCVSPRKGQAKVTFEQQSIYKYCTCNLWVGQLRKCPRMIITLCHPSTYVV